MFDWKNPDYLPVFSERMRRMQELREDPARLAALKLYYSDHPADFINDWGVTFDPRNAARGLPNVVPFLLFPRQREWVDWLMERMSNQEDGITEKSRDMGITWLEAAVGVTLCLFRPYTVVGYGSRKEALVDKAGDPDSIFWKARMFLELLPVEFRGGWTQTRPEYSTHLQLKFPDTDSIMRGEAGDNIGRGGRASLYFTDEDAFIPRCAVVDAALSQTTNCRQRVSTVNGRQNPFAKQRWSGSVPVFTFHWRSDPRKDDAWYEKQKGRLDPVILAQEVDISYDASVEGVLIPRAWVEAAVNAAEVLGVEVTGASYGGLDVADEGRDKNAYASRKGIELRYVEEWSGKESDIYETVIKAFQICTLMGDEEFAYDADGLGAGVRGDARVINERREAESLPTVAVEPFRGSGAVLDPDMPIETIDDDSDRLERYNKDYFQNAKAQSWWSMRLRFQRTYRAIEALKRGEAFTGDADKLISISPFIPDLDAIKGELSQPQWKTNDLGKIVIEKTPDDSKSPNKADSIMIAFAPRNRRRSILEIYQ